MSTKRHGAQALLLCCMCVCLTACKDGRTTSQPASSVATHIPPTEWFTDATAETHLDFVHINGMTGQFYYPEIIAPGVALLDYDNDEDLDVFLVQGGRIDRRTRSGSGDLTKGGRLYRNDLELRPDGSRVVRFSDVTDASRINAVDYGMGAAVGDYDNDGCVDLYVTALGRNHLFRNQCDGTFTDVPAPESTTPAGACQRRSSTSIATAGWISTSAIT